MREYEEICFWDTDFAFLDDLDEESLIHSDIGGLIGLSERRDTNIIEFPLGDGEDKNIKMEIKLPPWDMEDENWDDLPFS